MFVKELVYMMLTKLCNTKSIDVWSNALKPIKKQANSFYLLSHQYWCIIVGITDAEEGDSYG